MHSWGTSSGKNVSAGPTRIFSVIFMMLSLIFIFSGAYSATLSSAQYSTLSGVLDTHLNYFLSPKAVTSYGMPLGAYKMGETGARFNYSNPAEWGYLLQAYIAAAEKGKISKSDAAAKIATTLTTVKAIQDNSSQYYNGKLFYPYYYVANYSTGAAMSPQHDPNLYIPSMDNALFYMSLAMVDGWALDNNNAALSAQARAIYSKMNFSPFLFTDSTSGKKYMSLNIHATTGVRGGKCDIYSNEGGLTTMIAYLSGSIDLQTYKDLTSAQLRGPASWNGITVQEADWFNPMFTWGVRPLAGIPVTGSPYSTGSFAQAYKGHLAYGNYIGADYPAFSDAMTQGVVANYFPPNISGQMTTTIKNVTPHAFFVPLNILSDLDQATLDTTFAKIDAMMSDTAKYYYKTGDAYPFGFVVATSPKANDTTYAGAIPADGKNIFETLSEGYIALSAYNALSQQDNGKEFSYFLMKAPNLAANYKTVVAYLYPSYSVACYVNTDCGADQNIGELTCLGNSVVQTVRTFTCQNPGASNAKCAATDTNIVRTFCAANQVCSNATCINPACTTNSQCGTDAYIGTASCSGLNIVQPYRTFTCNNPGTINASCSSADENKVKSTCLSTQVCSNATCISPLCSKNSDCGTDGFYGARYCYRSNMITQQYRTYLCKNPGTTYASCSYSSGNKIAGSCSGNQVCSGGNCYNVQCTSSYDCGTNGYVGTKFCSGNNIAQIYRTHYCTNRGSTLAKCTYQDTTKVLSACSSTQSCSNGSCVGSAIWTVTPTYGGKYFNSITCNVLSPTTCPPEMGWEGNKVMYAFKAPASMPSTVNLTFNVIYKNYGGTKNVLLNVSAGKTTLALTAVRTGLEINALGTFTVPMSSSLFTPGATNYIQLYGTNITPVGYGTNPPNFKINSITLK